MGSSRSIIRAIAIPAALVVFFLADPTAQAWASATSIRVVRSADVGTSVRTDAWISGEAEFLSGRRLTVVCATSAQEWQQALAVVGFPSAAASQYYGYSLIGPGELHLSPYVCEGLRLGNRVSTRRRNELQVAWSVNVLVHESVHMGRFTTDEALTEACARTGLPGELHRLFGVAYRSAELSRLTLAATWFRRTQGPAYQGGTCAAASQ
jgi:hypothetical protein